MSKGCFYIRSLREEKDIDFAVYTDVDEKEIPVEQKQLRLDIEQTLIVLRGIFKEDEISFNKYYEQLLSLAEAGLKVENVTPIIACEGLMTLKKEIVFQEAGKIKNKYIKSLGRSVLCFIGFYLTWISFFYGYVPIETCLMWVNFFIMLIGTTVGVWLSFGIRKVDLKFDELHIIEEDRFEPTIRILFVSLLAVIVGLLFSTEAVVIKLGALSTNMLNYDSKVALLLGLLLGLGEKMLAVKVAEHATKILKI
ncbi:hypothetical protein [Sporomusa sp. KB1]|jgi:hypothetical protein|uniref:hypothetical protein n=1 Tax=Sporomusa sp. KB1 TaxID=943346 RepID=UPI0011A511D3|nr:hypothetical protein [Sporomusa sp. KB1]TWH47768.1 hypothetical protein Salpa_3854 [Sporomusa sp. KB1]